MNSIPKYSLTCEILFDAAHRLSNYEGKCKRIHGHTYKVLITVFGPTLNDWGALMDFGDLKKIMTQHIDEKYDHKLLLYMDDPINQKIINALPDKEWVVLMNSNTSAENIAKDIYKDLQAVLRVVTHASVVVGKVIVYETPKNAATYEEVVLL